MNTRLHAIVTAGGTREPIDDVRALTNASTGRLGVAIAIALAEHGVRVTLLASREAALHVPQYVDAIDVQPFSSTASLVNALADCASDPPHIVFMAAAIADYCPENTAGKIPSDQDTRTLRLNRLPKVLDTLRPHFGPHARLIGFKLLSGADQSRLIEAAKHQLDRAHTDVVIANDAQRFTESEHPVLWVTDREVLALQGTREEVAAQIVEHALAPFDTVLCSSLGPPLPLPPCHRAKHWQFFPDAITLDDSPRIEHDALEAHWYDLRAKSRHRMHKPVSICTTRGVAVGAARSDFALYRHAIGTFKTPRLRPIFVDGALVGGFRHDADGRVVLEATPQAECPLWPQCVREQLGSGPFLLVGDSAPWQAAGFHGPLDHATAPWARRDTKAGASAVLIHLPTEQVLLGWRRTGISGLAFPGGRQEAHESLAQTAKRELTEETGIYAPSNQSWAQWTLWCGHEPCWELSAFAWWVAEMQPPQPTRELDATWWPLRQAVRHPQLLDGVRCVLQDVIARIDRRDR